MEITPRSRRPLGLLTHVFYISLLLLVGASALWQTRSHRTIDVTPVAASFAPPYMESQVVVHRGKMRVREYVSMLAKQSSMPIIELGWGHDDEHNPELEMSLDGKVTLGKALEQVSDVVVAPEEHAIYVGPDEAVHSRERCITVVYPVGDFLYTDDAYTPTATSADRLRDLSSLIEEGVDEVTWEEYGGSIGRITSVGETLAVTTTPDIQYKVACVLAALRRGGGR